MMKISLFGVLALACTVVASESDYNNLNCKGVHIRPLQNVPVDTDHPCYKILKHQNETLELFVKLGLAEECICNLVDREVIWKLMMTDEVKTAYKALESNIEPAGRYGIQFNYFAFFKKAERSRNHEWNELSNLSNRDEFPKACDNLKANFDPIWQYFQVSAKMMGNTEWAELFRCHDENLTKLLVTKEFCLLIQDKMRNNAEFGKKQQ